MAWGSKSKDKGRRQQQDCSGTDRGPQTCPDCRGNGRIYKHNLEQDEEGCYDGMADWPCARCNETGRI
ncbi:hypothetical protein [Frankia sp. Cr2]|uniref:hypothetical protein n=1 Tax=Frankia sp. Cr2 TaxID=3073932 RepID=UPI002AD31108|nr:hypothetical protein [Frankia sp. Cr2]